jgi:hypothetical protein
MGRLKFPIPFPLGIFFLMINVIYKVKIIYTKKVKKIYIVVSFLYKK